MNIVMCRGRARACLGLLLSAFGGMAVAAECSVVNYSCEAPASTAVQRAGAATVMLRFPGASQCTGTLVNNGRNDDRPFILTARHCAGPVADAQLDALATAVQIIYRREAGCDDGTRAAERVRYGAMHRASFQDAWLIEALDPVPAEAAAWFAGLDVDGAADGARYGVHHGNGGYKQFVAQQVQAGNLLYLVLDTLGILVNTWHTRLLAGTTPNGASGSALFDDATRVSGVLSGGVICSGDVQGNDYQQLTVAWAGGGTRSTGLKSWLDPDATGFRLLSARGAQAAPADQGGEEGAGNGGAAAGGGAYGALLPALAALLRGAARRRRATGSVGKA